jgi:anaerobic ribonucleoside-triphosphate reductase activating protein
MASQSTLRVHSLVPRSRIAGPGLRFLIHTQGCTLGCRGCFNPETHDPQGGEALAVEDLARTIAASDGIEGITVSGGEPLQQVPALTELLVAARRAGLSVVLYSGYTRAEIEAMPCGPAVLAAADVLIDGRYDIDAPCHDGYRGSLNQRLHFLTDRYSPADFPPQPAAFEAEIGPDGAVTVRGFPDEALRRALGGLLQRGDKPRPDNKKR